MPFTTFKCTAVVSACLFYAYVSAAHDLPVSLSPLARPSAVYASNTFIKLICLALVLMVSVPAIAEMCETEK